MKKIITAFVVLLISVSMSSCSIFHEHNWQEATCEKPKTCSECDETEGTANGHQWQEPTCIKAKRCTVCKKKDSEALGHQWKEATYTTPKTCERCGLTEGEKLRLSDTCDDVLRRIDYNDNEYEIVMNRTEDYSGVHVEVGIIKDNKWLLKPTAAMPFVKNVLYSSDPRSAGDVSYIGKGCFVSEKSTTAVPGERLYTFYNVVNQKSHAVVGHASNAIPLEGGDQDDYFIISHHYDSSSKTNHFELLNKTSMETKTISLKDAPKYWNGGEYGAISEGVFWVSCHMPLADYKSAFYDTDGNKAIDLSSYCVVSGQTPTFWNGKCSIKIRNNNNHYYKIIIDKEGNVLDSKETSEN